MIGIPLLPCLRGQNRKSCCAISYPGTVLHLSDLGTADPERLVRELEEGAAGVFVWRGALRVLSENSMEHLNQVKNNSADRGLSNLRAERYFGLTL
jgi:hypothetical protein